jgi:hypothetical protein
LLVLLIAFSRTNGIRLMSLRDKLLKLTEAMAAAAPDRLRLAHREEDATTREVKDAAHFLKIDGRRCGRDIELYGFMGELYGTMGEKRGDWNAIIDFTAEVGLPVKNVAPAAYAVAAEQLKVFAREYLEGDELAEWETLLEDVPATPSP